MSTLDDDDDDPAVLRSRLEAAERARDEAVQARARDRREAQHELRNMLAIIRSLARRAADGATSVEEYRSLLDGRLAAYFGIQSALAMAPERGIELGNLIGDQLLRFGLRVDEHVAMSGAPVRLTTRTAGLLALAFHELASDFVASGRSDGQIVPAIRWDYADGGNEVLRVDWTEDGATARFTAADRCHAWLDWLDQAIVYELDGDTELVNEPGRLRYSVRLPALCCLPEANHPR
jgi:two-component system CheB/CheR fusion protein